MKIALFANSDWYLYNFRLSLAIAARARGHDLILISPPGPYGARLLEMGWDWRPVPMERRSLNPFREFFVLRWLRSFLVLECPDVIHNFTIKCAIYGSLAALSVKRGRRPRRINAIAGMGYVFTSDEFLARILRPLVRWLFKLALTGPGTRLIVQNDDDARFFSSQGLAPFGRLSVIRGSGVDCRRFSPDLQSEVRRSRLRILLAARVLWDKGVREFVEAARALRDDANLEFLIAGHPDPGNPAAVPQQQLECWTADGLLTWLGHVEDMPALFRSADIVVLPSYREGLPKGLIEAGACGIALVTTDVPGCRDVVSGHGDGLLVPARDSRALAQAINRLCQDTELRRRLGNASRMKVLANFDELLINEQTCSIYHDMATAPR